MRNKLLYYAIKYKGEFKAITNAVLYEEPINKIDYDGKYITILDEDYPECLLNLQYKPWVLFYEGDISLLKKEAIAVIGSRHMSDYAKECTKMLNEHLNNEYAIVSGLAKGVDAQAHKYALDTKRKCIAIIGCGIDVYYPKENKQLYDRIKKEALIISEYPYGTPPLAHHFPWRNRIIAALSKAVVVVEARHRSGTMITVNEALELGIPIYCFPHRITDENAAGCNELIAQGSGILVNQSDMKEI